MPDTIETAGEAGPGLLARLNEPTPRRSFLAFAGLCTASAAVVGCGGGGGGPKTVSAGGSGRTVTIDFSKPAGLVNYAYALEQLEAAFYTEVNKRLYSNASGDERQVLHDLKEHETAHAGFFASMLGSKGIPQLTPDFSRVDFSRRASVLGTAKSFENLGVWAYNGAGQLIDPSGPLGLRPLMAAGEIVSVEARHASVINELVGGRTSTDFAPSAFDKALPPSKVLPVVAPFLKDKIKAVNLPPNA